MANLDYQAQLTQLYNKLSDIDARLAKLALSSDVNTKQSFLSASLRDLIGKLTTMTGEVEKIKLTIADILTELRSK